MTCARSLTRDLAFVDVGNHYRSMRTKVTNRAFCLVSTDRDRGHGGSDVTGIPRN